MKVGNGEICRNLKRYHEVWIKYFTIPYALDVRSKATLTPIDLFLDSFNYSPVSVNDVITTLNTLQSSASASECLANLFEFDKIDILKVLIMAKNQMDNHVEREKSPNSNLIPEYIMRGFLSISFRIKKDIENELKTGQTQTYWDAMPYLFEYLLTTTRQVIEDLLASIEPFVSAFGNLTKIYNLGDSSNILKSLPNLLCSLLPFLVLELDTRSFHIFNFVFEAFVAWQQTIIHTLNYSQFSSFATSFLNDVSGFISRISPFQQKQLIVITGQLIDQITDYGNLSYEEYISTLIQCISFISEISPYISEKRAAIDTILISSITKFSKIIKDHIEYNLNVLYESEEISMEEDPKQYLDLFKPINEDIVIINPDISLSFAIIQRFFSIASPETIQKILSEIVKEVNETKDLKLAVVFLIIIMKISEINGQNELTYFLKTFFLEQAFPEKFETVQNLPIEIKKYQSLYMIFLTKYSSSHPSKVEMIFNSISDIVAKERIEFFMYFIPYIRTLLRNGKISSVLLNSSLPIQVQASISISQNQLLADHIAYIFSFISLSYTKDIMESMTFLHLCSDFLQKPRYGRLLIVCFDAYLNSAARLNQNESEKILDPTLNQLTIVFLQTSVNSSLFWIASDLITALQNFVIKIRYDPMEIFEKTDLLRIVSILAQKTKDSSVFNATIKFLVKLCRKFPEAIVLLNQHENLVYDNLLKALPLDKPSEETVRNLEQLMFNNKEIDPETNVIENIGALVILLHYVDGLPCESDVYDLLIKISRSNVANAYQCFSCDLCGIVLQRLQKSILNSAVALFSIVCQNFFSQRTLREIVKSLNTSERNTRNTIVIDALVALMNNDIPHEVSSLFHLSGKQSDIAGPIIPSDELKPPFAFVFSCNPAKTKQTTQSVFSAIDGEMHFFNVFIEGFSLCISIETANVRFTKVIGTFKRMGWQKMLFWVNKNTIDAFINDRQQPQIEIEYPEFSSGVHIYIGSFSGFYSGDLGQILLARARTLKQAQEIYSMFNRTITAPSQYILCYLPRNARSREILNVTPSGDKAAFNGIAVPFVNSIGDVMKYDTTFELILPLFLQMNQADVEPNDMYFQSLLRLLCSIFSLDPVMEVYFETYGGFQLLSGFLSAIEASYYQRDIVADFVYLFNSSSRLRRQMVEFVFLNFPLFSRMDSEFQIEMGNAVIQLIDDHFEGIYFQNIEFLLYYVTLSPQICNYTDTVSSGIGKNTMVTESMDILPIMFLRQPDDLDSIKEMQWEVFRKLYNRSPSMATLKNVCMIMCWHKDLKTKERALSFFTSRVSKETNDARDLNMLIKLTDVYTLAYVNGHPRLKIQILKDILGLSQYKKMIWKLSFFSDAESFNETAAIASFEIVFGCSFKDILEGKATKVVAPEVLTIALSSLCVKNPALSNFQRSYTKNIVQSMSKVFVENPHTIGMAIKNASWISYMMPLFENYLSYEDAVSTFTSIIISNATSGSYKVLIILGCVCRTISAYHSDRSKFLADVGVSVLRLALQKNLDQHFMIKLVEECLEWYLYPPLSEKEFIPITYDQITKYLGEDCSDDKAYKEGPTRFHPMTDNKDFKELMLESMDFIMKENNDGKIQLPYSITPISTIKKYLIGGDSDDQDQKMKELINGFSINNSRIPNVLVQSHKKERENILQNLTRESFVIPEFISLLSFQEFEKNQERLQNLQFKHTQKMMLSFMRDVRTNGGPWTTRNFFGVKWKYENRTDPSGRSVFLKVNQNFDDHKAASTLRETLKDEQEMPFKRVGVLSIVNIVTDPNKSIANYSVTCRRLSGHYKGTLHVLKDRVSFDGVFSADTFGASDAKHRRSNKFIDVPFSNMAFVFKRYFMHNDISLEIFTWNYRSHLFIFENEQKRDDFLKTINNTNQEHGHTDFFFGIMRKRCGGCVQDCSDAELMAKSKLTKKWVKNKISTFQYLFYINIISGRSFHDVSQYPVFPWIIADYDRETFDLNDETFFRDLSKPVGALNEKRLAQLEAVNEIVEDESQKCLYRSNFSNPSAVLGYLIRTEPFATLHIRLQDGRFDNANRLFTSISRAWFSVNHTTGDYRELIPQFYSNPEFLTNSNGFDLGKLLDGTVVNDVVLPKWAKDPQDFVLKMRMALECDYVSAHIGQWIDITFGAFQRSPQKKTLFHLFSYHEASSKVTDETEIELMRDHCANFGSLPARVFSQPHPKRKAKANIQMQIPLVDNRSIISPVVFFDRRVLIDVHGTVCVLRGQTVEYPNAIPNVVSAAKIAAMIQPFQIFVVPPSSTFVSVYGIGRDGFCERAQINHTNAIVEAMAAVGDRFVLTGGSDCVVYIWHAVNHSLLGTLHLHSSPVIAITGDASLDLCVSIDTEHQVFFSTITERRLRVSFRIECDDVAVHRICISGVGIVAISTHSAAKKKSELVFYDLCGRVLSQQIFAGCIEKILSITSVNFENFFVLSMASRRIILLRSDFTKIKEYSENFDPQLISFAGNWRAICYTNPKGEICFIQF